MQQRTVLQPDSKQKELIQNLLDKNSSPPKGSWLPSVGDVLNAPTRDTVATDCTRGCLTNCGAVLFPVTACIKDVVVKTLQKTIFPVLMAINLFKLYCDSRCVFLSAL